MIYSPTLKQNTTNFIIILSHVHLFVFYFYHRWQIEGIIPRLLVQPMFKKHKLFYCDSSSCK